MDIKEIKDRLIDDDGIKTIYSCKTASKLLDAALDLFDDIITLQANAYFYALKTYITNEFLCILEKE